MGENEIVKIARLEERMDNVEDTQKVILKKQDERDARSNSQLFMIALNLLGIIVTLAIILIQGGAKP